MTFTFILSNIYPFHWLQSPYVGRFFCCLLLCQSEPPGPCPKFTEKYSSCTQPPPPPTTLALDGKFQGVGTLELSNPPGWGRKKEGKYRLPSTLQHFPPIAQSNTAVLSILMCDFFFQLTYSFVIP